MVGLSRLLVGQDDLEGVGRPAEGLGHVVGYVAGGEEAPADGCHSGWHCR